MEKNKDWKERLKEFVDSEDRVGMLWACEKRTTDYKRLEDFISTLLEEARKEEREKILDIIDKVRKEYRAFENTDREDGYYIGIEHMAKQIRQEILTSKEEKK